MFFSFLFFKKSSKKASANMWWIIIGAAIALIVMIVLLFLFTSKTSNIQAGLSDCEGKGGVCASVGECPRNTLQNRAFDCSNDEVCCLGIPVSCENPEECQKDNPNSDCVNNYCT
jgi:hypothetical protein